MKKTKDNYFTRILRYNDACLAPLAGVTDMAYRKICGENGCEVMFTEMVSAKGIFYKSKNTAELLLKAEEEKNTGVQIFGSDAEIMARVVKDYINHTDFAFVDINMGCPVRKIFASGDGAALLFDIDKLAGVAESVVKASAKPVSAKIRLGINSENIIAVKAAKALEDSGIQMITVHGRTAAQMYSGSADWDEIARVVDSAGIPVVANGDVRDVESYTAIKARTDCAGVMIGRACLGNPFIFRQIRSYRESGIIPDITTSERLDTARRHLEYLSEIKPENVAVNEFRKHLAWYTRGMKNSSKLRGDINGINSTAGFYEMIDKIRDE